MKHYKLQELTDIGWLDISSIIQDENLARKRLDAIIAKKPCATYRVLEILELEIYRYFTEPSPF